MQDADEEYIPRPHHGGCSGFGSGEKYKIVVHMDFDWDRDRRGHDDTRKHKKSQAERQQRLGHKRCARIVDDRIVTEWLWADSWNPDFADFRGEMEFHKRADQARHYAGLISQVSPELRADWADYDSPYWEIALFYEDMDEVLDKEFNDYEWGYYLRSPSQPSSEGWWFMDLPHHERLDFTRSEWQEYLYQQHVDYMNHMFNDYDMYGFHDDTDYDDDRAWDMPETVADDDDFDMYIPTVEEIDDMIAHQEAEEDRLIETLPISQFGGCRGMRAIKSVERNQTRPHHFLQAA